MQMKWVCRCGHPTSDHTGSSGPNSIGRWSFGECTNGCSTVGPYRIGGCRCRRFRRKTLPVFEPRETGTTTS